MPKETIRLTRLTQGGGCKVAPDVLREILAGLRIPADLERIGDYAANGAQRSVALNTSPPLPHVAGRKPSSIIRPGSARNSR